MNRAFRAERGPSLLIMRAGHIHAQVPKLQLGVRPLLVLTLDPLPPKGSSSSSVACLSGRMDLWLSFWCVE